MPRRTFTLAMFYPAPHFTLSPDSILFADNPIQLSESTVSAMPRHIFCACR